MFFYSREQRAKWLENLLISPGRFYNILQEWLKIRAREGSRERRKIPKKNIRQ